MRKSGLCNKKEDVPILTHPHGGWGMRSDGEAGELIPCGEPQGTVAYGEAQGMAAEGIIK